MKRVGYLHFRTVDSMRYEIWRSKSSGEAWYHYPVGSDVKYRVYLPRDMFGGWAALMRSKIKGKEDKESEDASEDIMVVLSTAFAFADHVDEISHALNENGAYPLKYAVKRGADRPRFVDNAGGLNLEVPIEYIDSIMKKREIQESIFGDGK